MDLPQAAIIALLWATFASCICAFVRGASDRRHAEWKRAVGIDVKHPAASTSAMEVF
ncbi:hypothetical protein [Caballeronia sp. AZ10_KS36]|uniref:hypothetical protein n=1 Tax=Caballeronia sp. AZ10_KS36 TaxID=2921757 RepID=UPI002028D20C|nr:hypothetical protein [Caballeronia sp. AZ10_KS36]